MIACSHCFDNPFTFSKGTGVELYLYIAEGKIPGQDLDLEEMKLVPGLDVQVAEAHAFPIPGNGVAPFQKFGAKSTVVGGALAVG